MTQTNDPTPERGRENIYPEAEIHPRSRFSLIWLIPLVAIAVAAYLAWHTLSQEGPTITVSFNSADGITAGQTKVRHKAVDLGTVRSINLSKDMSHVVVRIEMRRDAAPFLTDKARFWVVRPRLSAGDISGLETIVSGAYIELDPGRPDGNYRYHFTGLENPPAIRSDEPGTTYTLRALDLGQLGPGAPVFYRDRTVGEIIDVDPGKPGELGSLHAFVREPYDRYIHDGSYFWQASGLSVTTEMGGLHVQVESLQALLSGAIAFDTSSDALKTPLATSKTRFFLFRDRATGESTHYRQQLRFLVRFTGDASGLHRGSSLVLFGLRVGYVEDVHLEYDPKTNKAFVEAHIEVQPERLQVMGRRPDPKKSMQAIAEQVEHGLRVQIQTESYITGSQDIAFVYRPDAPKATLTKVGDDTLMPSVAGADIGSLTTELGNVAASLNQIPFAQIGANLNKTLEGVSKIANGQELKNTLASVSATMQDIQHLVKHTDHGLTPLLDRLPGMSADLQKTLAHANRLVSSLDNGYGANSAFNREMERLMAQLNDTARSIRALADLLDTHPEALIRGRASDASGR